MILNKAKYNVRTGKWSIKYITNGKSDDDNWSFVKWKTKEKIPHNGKLFVEWKTKKKIPHNGKANNMLYKENVQTNFQSVKLQTEVFPYAAVLFVTVTIIDNQPDTKLIGETKWANTKYKQVLRYYQEKDEKEADTPYLYI